MMPNNHHYCWFGGKELPQSALSCIQSWKDFMSEGADAGR